MRISFLLPETFFDFLSTMLSMLRNVVDFPFRRMFTEPR